MAEKTQSYLQMILILWLGKHLPAIRLYLPDWATAVLERKTGLCYAAK
jgi:hypothetical protein